MIYNSKTILVILVCLLRIPALFGQPYSVNKQNPTGKSVSGPVFTAMFYNVENLYDTLNDPSTDDDEFTPQGRIPWTSERYTLKLANLAKVLSSVLAPQFPDIIGLAEVENRKVLEQLIVQPALSGTSYWIVHFDSPDERGIDVALLYNRKTFTVTHSEPIMVNIGDDKTRDILFVTGKTKEGTVLNIFINHWPSRREGADVSETKRMAAAGVLRKQVDKLIAVNSKVNILIMGDFNDNPDNRSITETLGVNAPESTIKQDKLYSLLLPRFKTGNGSLYYKSWDLFDQIIVSGNLLKPKKGLDCSPGDAKIFNAKWLMFTNNNGDDRPNRTMGNKYFGGYSDHLPVYVSFK